MAWVKIPPENHPLFRAALPRDPRIQTLNMFGGVAAKVNGHLFGGTFGRSVMLLLSEEDRATALALDGAAPFDPMGNGAMRSDKVQMPDSLMDEPDDLRGWVTRAFNFAATLPAKATGGKAPAAKKPTPKAPAMKVPAAKTAANAPAAKASAKKASAAKKPAAKPGTRKPAAKPGTKKPAAKAAAAKRPSSKSSLTARKAAATKRAAK